MASDRADLQARARALMQQPPAWNPDWPTTTRNWTDYWNQPIDNTKTLWDVLPDNVTDWENHMIVDALSAVLKDSPFVRNFPDFFNASWEASATVEWFNGSIVGPSMEWQQMLAVRTEISCLSYVQERELSFGRSVRFLQTVPATFVQ